ncbi:hypothetical protein GQ42DRAFT_160920 [Ramicandelaber brevisporus]|nr:hypothetical protein GQ42DRAFT_160920 [Ramicandelaber brevisporus]
MVLLPPLLPMRAIFVFALLLALAAVPALAELRIVSPSSVLAGANLTVHDFYGDNRAPVLDTTAQLVLWSFSDNSGCNPVLTPASSPSPSSSPSGGSSSPSTVILFNYFKDSHEANCMSPLTVRKRLDQVLPLLNTQFGNPKVAAVLFSSMESHATNFGSGGDSFLNSYYKYVPDGLRIALMSDPSGRALRDAIQSYYKGSGGDVQPIIASVTSEPGIWNDFLNSPGHKVLLAWYYVVFCPLALFAAYQLVLAIIHSRGRITLRVVLFYCVLVSLVMAAVAPFRDPSTRISSTLWYIGIGHGITAYALVIARWASLMQILKKSRTIVAARYASFAMLAFIVILCVLAIASLHVGQQWLMDLVRILLLKVMWAPFILQAGIFMYTGIMYLRLLRVAGISLAKNIRRPRRPKSGNNANTATTGSSGGTGNTEAIAILIRLTLLSFVVFVSWTVWAIGIILISVNIDILLPGHIVLRVLYVSAEGFLDLSLLWALKVQEGLNGVMRTTHRSTTADVSRAQNQTETGQQQQQPHYGANRQTGMFGFKAPFHGTNGTHATDGTANGYDKAYGGHGDLLFNETKLGQQQEHPRELFGGHHNTNVNTLVTTNSGHSMSNMVSSDSLVRMSTSSISASVNGSSGGSNAHRKWDHREEQVKLEAVDAERALRFAHHGNHMHHGGNGGDDGYVDYDFSKGDAVVELVPYTTASYSSPFYTMAAHDSMSPTTLYSPSQLQSPQRFDGGYLAISTAGTPSTAVAAAVPTSIDAIPPLGYVNARPSAEYHINSHLQNSMNWTPPLQMNHGNPAQMEVADSRTSNSSSNGSNPAINRSTSGNHQLKPRQPASRTSSSMNRQPSTGASHTPKRRISLSDTPSSVPPLPTREQLDNNEQNAYNGWYQPPRY